MSAFESEKAPDRPERNWALEVLIVAGVVAFGYFAVMLQSQPTGFADRTLDSVAQAETTPAN
jgi:hypothetical protein